MTAPVTSEPKPASAASQKAEPITAKKAGFDPLRPVRYLTSFIGGTVTGGLDAMGQWGRKGAWAGLGITALLVVSGAVAGGLPLIVAGWAAGLAAGATAGAAAGVVSGGIRSMDRETRKDKYAEDLMRKARAKSQPTPSVDYRAKHRDHKMRHDYNFDRLLQQERENERDQSTYFQDLVNNSRQGHNHGIGF